jgi:NADH dehydrogenase [ubiquinone] 1 alpha subcomplex assembly factor 7
MWLASNWANMDSPKDTILVELGAGRGTLMADMLRATAKVPRFHSSISIHIIEISEPLKELQKHALSAFNVSVTWHDDISTLPKKPMLLAANEFFDALPIHQFIKQADGWRERTVTMNEQNELVYGITSQATPHCTFAPSSSDIANDAIFEFCPQAEAITESIAKHFAQLGGCALCIDYGYWNTSFKNTFQAAKNHKYHDPLFEPGSADLTAHVNFKRLANRATEAGAKSYIGVSQGEFLNQMGATIRASILKKSAPHKSEEIDGALNRLTSSAEMGELFKCIAITSPKLPTPYAFKDAS